MARLQTMLSQVRELDPRLRVGGSGGEKEEATGGKQVSIPVVLLSNAQQDEAEVQALGAGFAAVIVKPLRKSAFAARIKEILDRSSVQGSAMTLPSTGVGRQRGMVADTELQALLVGKHFIVVDDNAINRKVASKVLEKYGVTVTCFDGAQKVVEALEGDHEFDMVFTDIQMPEMDGYKMTRAIRAKEVNGMSKGPHVKLGRQHVPVVAMSADVMKDVQDKCMESGMDGFATKPIEEARLLQLVKSLLLPLEDDEY